MATSSTTESIFVQRKRQRQANFLEGRARSVHRLNESLETGLVETVALNSCSSTPPSIMCKRGCPQILCGLKATYDAVGLHPAKVHQQRLASYPLPKKQKRAHRNITGKLTVLQPSLFITDINNSNTDRKHRNNYTHFLSLSLSKAQNRWLRQNVIDEHGNFLFCRDCLVACLDEHTTRLQNQRLIKQITPHPYILA